MTDSVSPFQDLELDLNPEETARAQKPNDFNNLDSDATHPLTEAPTPAGAIMESEPLLEPLLFTEPVTEGVGQTKAQPPVFFQRLSLAVSPAQIQIHQELDHGYSLRAGDNWPVFVLRKSWLGPIPAQEVKNLAAVARKLGGDLACFGPYNELDIFFNDRKSLERAARELNLNPEPRPTPFRLMACPGLLFCPHAAKDTLSAANVLFALGQAKSWPTIGERAPVIISVAGCPAGQGQDCGLYDYADLTLQGQRRAIPTIDQKVASLSPKRAHLVANCPGQALYRPADPNQVLAIDQNRCRRCGWCVHEDPSLAWPIPQGGYFRLLLSGRRPGPSLKYAPSQTIWEPTPEDLTQVGHKIFELLERWTRDAQPLEPLFEFMERAELMDYFAPQAEIST
jgi:dissimilatory sulfite reductase (desulfoviridin) alpha/beta subunit